MLDVYPSIYASEVVYDVVPQHFRWRECLPPKKLVTMPADIIDELAAASLLVVVALAHIRWPLGSGGSSH